VHKLAPEVSRPNRNDPTPFLLISGFGVVIGFGLGVLLGVLLPIAPAWSPPASPFTAEPAPAPRDFTFTPTGDLHVVNGDLLVEGDVEVDGDLIVHGEIIELSSPTPNARARPSLGPTGPTGEDVGLRVRGVVFEGAPR
jgi:hypothetical protein